MTQAKQFLETHGVTYSCPCCGGPTTILKRTPTELEAVKSPEGGLYTFHEGSTLTIEYGQHPMVYAFTAEGEEEY